MIGVVRRNNEPKTNMNTIAIGTAVYVKSINAFGTIEDIAGDEYMVTFGSDSLDEIFGFFPENDLRTY